MSPRRVAAWVTAVLLAGVVSVAVAPPAAAASYSFSSCQQSGTGTPPPGLDQVTFDVTGSAPATAVNGSLLDVSNVKVTLHNPLSSSIDTTVTSVSMAIPSGASALTNGFASAFPFSIPPAGDASFSGALQYIATGAPGTVLEFRPSLLIFNLSQTLAVSCNVASGGAFASTVVTDAPGYQFSCTVPSLGVSIPQTLDIVGTAPATIAQGSPFSLSGVVTTTTPPLTTTVLSSTFTLATPPNATPASPLSVTMPGPFTVTAGAPYVSPSMSFDFVASGAIGSVVEFQPASITTDTQSFGLVTCAPLSGQPPIATTTITAGQLDTVGAVVVRPNGKLAYAQFASLISGDFDLAHSATGAIAGVTGEGTFAGPNGGLSDLRVTYDRPVNRLRLRDPASGLDLRATSFIPAVRVGAHGVVGVAFGRLDDQTVMIIWAIRDHA